MKWLIQILAALMHCHNKCILHRDLKPQNIFLKSNGIIKLGDFGEAIMLNNAEEYVDSVTGTPCYMPPEMYNKKPYNFKADMWSLGCILYELCALVPPFAAQNILSLSELITKGLPVSIPIDYSENLRLLISNLLSVNQDNRPSADNIFGMINVLLILKVAGLFSMKFTNLCLVVAILYQEWGKK